MIEIVITIILIVFIGLFAALSFPMKDEAEKLDKETKTDAHRQQFQDS